MHLVSTTHALLQRLHEESQREIIARARAQFQGPNEAFPTLVDEYEALAPRLRGRFLETFGLFTEDFELSAGSALSLAVSAETGRFLRNMVLAQRPTRILELGSSCGVSTLYFADGGFNRSMQHTTRCVSNGGVANETAPQDLLHRDSWSLPRSER